MYLLTPLITDCQHFFNWNVPPELRKGDSILVDFKSFYEVVGALAAVDLKPDRDFLIE